MKFSAKGQWGPCNKVGYFSLVERLSEVLIRNLPSHLQQLKQKTEMLGLFTCPSGGAKASLIKVTNAIYLK